MANRPQAFPADFEQELADYIVGFSTMPTSRNLHNLLDDVYIGTSLAYAWKDVVTAWDQNGEPCGVSFVQQNIASFIRLRDQKESIEQEWSQQEDVTPKQQEYLAKFQASVEDLALVLKAWLEKVLPETLGRLNQDDTRIDELLEVFVRTFA